MEQRIFNEHTICEFFQQIPQNQKYSTLKQLVLLGINAINIRINKANFCTPSTYQNLSKFQLISELEQMRKKIDNLASILNQQQNKQHLRVITEPQKQEITFKPIIIKQQNNFDPFKQIRVSSIDNKVNELKQNITPKVTQINPVTEPDVFAKPCSLPKYRQKKCMSRHHLDDSEVRQALVNPFAKETPTKKNKKDKQYIYQEEVDKEEMKIIHANYQEKDQALGKSKRSRVSQMGSINNYNVESKIRSLVVKDKIKYKQHNQQIEYNKYQYSSQEDEASQIQQVENQESSNSQSIGNKVTAAQIPHMSQNNLKQTIQFSKNVSSKKSKGQSFRKNSQKRKNIESKEESSDYSDFRYENERGSKRIQPAYEEDEQNNSDAVSQSSSFSKFSLGSQREVGKIGVRR